MPSFRDNSLSDVSPWNKLRSLWRSMGSNRLSLLTRMVIFSALYFLGGILGRESSFIGGTVALVWPPSGIALAAVVLYGYRFWPGVAFGAFFFSVAQGNTSLAFILMTAVGNTVGALACAYLLDRIVRFNPSMERVRDVAGLVALASMLGTTVNAGFTVMGLCYSGELAWEAMFPKMMEWWMPNAMAGLVVTPFILSWAVKSHLTWKPLVMLEAACCAAGLAAGTLISFTTWYAHGIQNYPLAYLPYPFLVWGALRFGQRGATTGTLLVASVAIYQLLRSRGPFVTASERESLMLIGSYIGVLGVTNLLLAAVGIERFRAERAVQESERRYRGVVEDQAELICRFDPDGKLTFVNGAYCRFHRRTREELIGQPFAPNLMVGEREISLGEFTAAGLDEPVVSFDGRVVRSDREVVWQLCTVRRLIDDEGGGREFQAVIQDITRRRQIEEQLRQAQRMEAIGQLAGGIAHDFNNLLIIIKGYMTLLLNNTGYDEKTVATLKKVLTAGERASSLTQQLLMFSRKQALRFQILNLNEVLQETTRMLGRLIGENIRQTLSCSEPAPHIRADAGMLQQVLLNLAVNARDAMKNGGDLHFSTSEIMVGETYVRMTGKGRPGEFICLTVRDTGSGIPPKDLPRIFEPFFTTKPDGEGTGLGLATVFGIVEQHDGWVTVDSEVGKGTVFRIYFPRIEPSKSGDPTVARPEMRVMGGNETILVVEDEGPLREVVRSILESYGYRVFDAPDANSALELWRNHRDEIDMLMTDMILPEGPSGKDLADRLLAEKPLLRVLYTSGYNMDEFRKQMPLNEGDNFLPKPYHPRMLAQAIASRLRNQVPGK